MPIINISHAALPVIGDPIHRVSSECATARTQLAKADIAFQARPLVNRLNPCLGSVAFALARPAYVNGYGDRWLGVVPSQVARGTFDRKELRVVDGVLGVSAVTPDRGENRDAAIARHLAAPRGPPGRSGREHCDF